MQDWRGTPLKVGSRVVYPSRNRNNMWVREATVTFVEEKFVDKFDSSWWERTVKIKSTDGRNREIAYERVTVIDPPLELIAGIKI